MKPEGQQRKEFEEWAKTQPRIREGLRLIRDSEGNYMSDDAEIAWEAWQASSEQLTAVTDQRDVAIKCHEWCYEDRKRIIEELTAVTEQRDRLAEAVNAATILIAAKGRHNTMLAYNGLRDTLKSLTQSPNNA
jgi:hypothetical protein